MDALREVVLPLLDNVKKSGAGFMARCPAHEDGTASLSVGPGRDHPVLLHCHAGCQPDDILAALGLTWADLSTPHDKPAEQGEWTPAGPAVAVYDYTDEQGKLLFQVLRTAKKDFRQRVPDPTAKTGWTWKLGEVRRVLYRLPAIIDAVREGREIFVCEGEKDVHALVAKGHAATCNSGGAGKWRAEYGEHLREAIVTVVADKDAPGQAHARQVVAALAGVAAKLRVVEAAAGKDAADHIAAGKTIDQFETVWTSDEDDRPILAPDLWEFLATDDPPYDWIVPDLLERGDRFMLTGLEGLGKSMLLRQIAVCIAAGLHPFTLQTIKPHRVLLIDCENSERQSRRRFRPLAAASVKAHRRVPEGNLRIIHRSAGIDLTRDDDAAWLHERVTAHQPDVLIIGPFYRLHRANINDELPARKTVAVLDQARTSVDCALIIEAHSGHGDPTAKQRSVRPAGSSLQLRWPEFGLGLRPPQDYEAKPGERVKEVDLVPWRGGRDDRSWPTRLVHGDEWPWVAGPDEPSYYEAFTDGPTDAIYGDEPPPDPLDRWPSVPPSPSGRVNGNDPPNGHWLINGKPA